MKRRVKIFLFFIIITLTTLSCNTVESVLCEFTGGAWVPVDYIENRPYDSDSADDECDCNFDPEKYQEWQLHGPSIEPGGENISQDVNNGKASGEDNSALEEEQSQPADSHLQANQPLSTLNPKNAMLPISFPFIIALQSSQMGIMKPTANT